MREKYRNIKLPKTLNGLVTYLSARSVLLNEGPIISRSVSMIKITITTFERIWEKDLAR
jgi:hypothetical protein